MISENFEQFLKTLEDCFPVEKIRRNFSLRKLTTYGVGGPAVFFLKVNSFTELEILLPVLRKYSVPLLVIGNGSNLLISDEGFKGFVIQLSGSFEEVAIENTTVRAGGAAKLPVVARKTANSGLSGFEWAVGVPGTVGGAVRMNAGGHGSDLAASLTEVKVADLSAEGADLFKLVPASDLGLSYRHSLIKDTDIVLEATLHLDIGEKEKSEDLLHEIVRWRRENQPGGQNSGSVFTNPEGDSAGRLIEIAGLKGFTVGSASVSKKHANFIQVEEGGKAQDVREVMKKVIERVEEVHSVTLVPETVFVGFERDSL